MVVSDEENEIIRKKSELFRRLTQEAMDDKDAVITKLAYRDVETLVNDANILYRAGTPVMSDWFYDNVLIEALRLRNPESEFLKNVEPEPEGVFGKTVRLPERMLSTDKAYSIDEIVKFVERAWGCANELGIAKTDVFFQVTPKLDGFAAYDNGDEMYTRGDGYSGSNISHVFQRGLTRFYRVKNSGKGEIVVNKEYFKSELSKHYENSRNVIGAAIKEGELDPAIAEGIALGFVTFVSFEQLIGWTRNGDDLIKELESIWDSNLKSCPFDTDGLVISVMGKQIREQLGSTNHHHRWQIAYKKNTEFHDIAVTGIEWQTSKNGRITPVVQLYPTKVSGVTISRATGHHAGNIMNSGIGEGAIVRVCRSGLVIPYITEVIKSVPTSWPDECPSCGSPTSIDGDNLLCSNEIDCPAQIERTIEHFFQTIGNCDGFGPKVIETLCKNGYDSVSKIYQMSVNAFEKCGFGKKTSENLLSELSKSRSVSIEDWRFLAAFGIDNVGKGGSERILRKYSLNDVFNCTVDDIVQIDGMGEKKAKSFIQSLKRISSEFDFLYRKLGFTLTDTKSSEVKTSSITGKVVVFTGSMKSGKRTEMEAGAKKLGAIVSGSVSKNTDILVCGENVGDSKMSSAKKNGTRILSEFEYLKMVS
mgnify:CR=1 FL=1